MNADGNIKAHKTHDVVLIRIGTLSGHILTPLKGVVSKTKATTAIVGLAVALIKSFDEALIGSEVFVFGYPRSLGIKKIPQLDYDKPLLRNDRRGSRTGSGSREFGNTALSPRRYCICLCTLSGHMDEYCSWVQQSHTLETRGIPSLSLLILFSVVVRISGSH